MKETSHFCLKQRTGETQQSQDGVRNSLGQHIGVLLLSVFTLPSSGAGCGRQASLVPTNTTQEVAAVGEFPWMVSLQDQGGHVALGSILSQDWILSTASSFHSRTQLSVLAGASDPKGPGESLLPIQTIVLHEAFDEITLVHNIALLKTSTPLRFSVTVQPICFPTSDFPRAALKKCFVAGWLDPPGGVGPLQKLPVEDVDPCPLHRTISTECCSHREGDQMPGCLGSAGNPVLCEAEGRQVLKGLLSKGGTRCYGPFVYSRLIYYSDWIVATTARWRAPASPFPGQRYQAFGGPAEEREGLLFEPFLDLRALNVSDASEDPLSLELSEELEESGLGPPKEPIEARVKLPLYYDYYGGELLAMSSAKPGHPWRLQGLLCMGLLLHLLAS
ncbi:inactive serine protease 54 isoform X2 [Crotalus tigris]|uniref:inactive serine protease 54 isoform X2 n=1 Tax=Crotalus tigris TaxID=88082 RepID=UPI00192F5154|nr:inactive serine protease 54 isoform X2 [Crotalus tigris]